MPRLDYSGGASCPSLLLEPQRSNLIRSGEYFGDWTLQGGGTGSTPVLEANTNDTLSPQGKYNAYKVTLDAGSGTTTSDESIMYISKSGLTSGSNHTASVYLKGAVGGEEVIVRDTEGSYKKWTLTAEWARYDYTQVAAAPSYATSFGIRQGVAGTINSDAVVYMFGFQSELGSYPTSYIPTYGSSVTRSGDIAGTIDVSSLDVTTNYTLFYEVSDFNVTANSTWVRQNGSNSSVLEAYGSTMILWIDGGVWYPFGHGVSGVGSNTKKAITYDGVKVRAYSDGVLVGTRDADKNRWDNLTDFYVTNGSLQMVNWNQVLIFPTALTDSECIALTTL
jgi:hypothetical protein